MSDSKKPCRGENTCCNRPEFDRVLFPCAAERQLERLWEEIRRLQAEVAELHALKGRDK